jgi:hypothetical protein
MGYNVHDVLRRFLIYYKKIKIKNWLWFEIIVFKYEHKIYKESIYFQKFIFIQKYKQKHMSST